MKREKTSGALPSLDGVTSNNPGFSGRVFPLQSIRADFFFQIEHPCVLQRDRAMMLFYNSMEMLWGTILCSITYSPALRSLTAPNNEECVLRAERHGDKPQAPSRRAVKPTVASTAIYIRASKGGECQSVGCRQ